MVGLRAHWTNNSEITVIRLVNCVKCDIFSVTRCTSASFQALVVVSYWQGIHTVFTLTLRA